MHFLRADTAIIPARALIEKGQSKEAHRLFFDAVDNRVEVSSFGLFGKPLQQLSRQWQLKPEGVRSLLRDVAARFDLSVEQIGRITSEEKTRRQKHGLSENISDPINNPYLLSERYVGDNPDDTMPWGTIDRGALPSPDLGGKALADVEFDDARRPRALCVEYLRREPNQTFRAADAVLAEVNARFANLPEWKKATFSARYFKVDRDILEECLVLRAEGERL